jgi:hypothetical protein
MMNWMPARGELIFWFFWWILLLPLFLVVATPFILVISIKGSGSYFSRIKNRYVAVVDFWKDNAWALAP